MNADSAAELLCRRHGRPVAARLVAQLVRRTDGDLALLEQVADQIDPDDDGLQRIAVRWPAERLAQVMAQLDGLTDEVRQVLGPAAVIGREFDLAVLELTCGQPSGPAPASGEPGPQMKHTSGLLDALDLAHAAGVLRQLTAGVFSFSTALHREVCYDALSARNRARWHERAAAALSGLGAFGGSRSVTITELAHHLAEAASLGGGHRLDAAIAASAAAGGVADENEDYELAAGLFAQAALLAGRAGWAPGPAGRLLVAAGVARLRSAVADSVRRAGVASLIGAVRLARRCGDEGLLAAAALGLGPRPTLAMGGGLAASDPERCAVLTQALGSRSELADSVSARLAARLALETEDGPLAGEALKTALASADPRAITEALLATVQCGEGDPAMLDQAVREATALHDRQLLARVYDERAWSAYRGSGLAEALPELSRLVELSGLATSSTGHGSAMVRWYGLRARAVLARFGGEPDPVAWLRRAMTAGQAVDPVAAAADAQSLARSMTMKAARPWLGELTSREREVAVLALRGTSTRDIAAALILGERTVESHLASIYRKLEIRSRVELIMKFGDGSAQLRLEHTE